MSELIKSIVVIADNCTLNNITSSLCKKCLWSAAIPCKQCILNPQKRMNEFALNHAINTLRNRKQS